MSPRPPLSPLFPYTTLFRSFYCNYADGSKRYEDFVTQELVAHVESSYRARKGRENRAIGGTSMGGFGALKIAMKDRKSTRLNSSHLGISYAVFCLNKKKKCS